MQALVALPPWWCAVLLVVAGIAACRRWPQWRWPALVLVGAGWTMLHAAYGLSQRLPPAFEGADLDVVGTIVGLPDLPEPHDLRGEAARIDIDVHSARAGDTQVPLRGLVRLSWYGPAPAVAPCETWRFTARLKRPRGLVNPGGFDFERYALQRGIVATGYVRDDAAPARLSTARFCVDAWRARIADAIGRQFGDTASAHLLAALAVGDQRGLDETEWQVLRATGIGHLIAISGFHIGMLAALGALLVRVAWRRWPRLVRHVPGPLLEAPFGLACATLYAALAGFGLPTLRTLAMIAVVALARSRRRHLGVAQGLALALLAILAVDPLAVLSASFWLSFAGVAWLVFCLDARDARGWRGLVAAQAVATLGLLPLTVWFFGQSSLVGPLANLVAVPWVSFVVVPLTVLGSMLVLVAPPVAAPVLQLAAWAMQALWLPLERLAALPLAQWYFPEPSMPALVLAAIGVAWLLLPRGVPMRWAGIALMLPLVWPNLPPPPPRGFEAMTIDVGQGLAVLVRTREHALLYDTGARFPSGFDLGETTVVPALHALGVRRLDRLMVSHGDNDHAGGAAAVVAAMRPAGIDAGEPERLSFPARRCVAGDAWEWDGVSFAVLHPAADFTQRGNDASCVLLVAAGDTRLLLTGDVSAEVEARIAESAGQGVTVLMAPHHGSKTSSGLAFLRALSPSMALVSAGYRNRFGHPHRDVAARYREIGAPLAGTAESGCIRVEFSPDVGARVVERCRQARRKYWNEF